MLLQGHCWSHAMQLSPFLIEVAAVLLVATVQYWPRDMCGWCSGDYRLIWAVCYWPKEWGVCMGPVRITLFSFCEYFHQSNFIQKNIITFDVSNGVNVTHVHCALWVHRAFQIPLQFLDPQSDHQVLPNLFWGVYVTCGLVALVLPTHCIIGIQ